MAKGDKRWQSKQYTEFIRSQPCIVGHKRGQRSQAHHTTSRKWVDGSDSRQISMCADCHMTAHHTVGLEPFFKERGIDLELAIEKLQDKFLRSHCIVWNRALYPSFESVCDVHGLNTRYEESKKVNRKFPFTKKFIPLDQRTDL